jgi:hypothetical protein
MRSDKIERMVAAAVRKALNMIDGSKVVHFPPMVNDFLSAKAEKQ